MIKYILAALGIGVVAGYLSSNWGSILVGNFISDYVFNGALLSLLLVMGASFGMDKDSIAKMRQTGIRILVVPFAIAIGSVLGGLIGGLILGIDVVACMAVSAGYGWYTLAGPLIGQLFGAEWGTLGFVSNFLRELLTIVAISLLIRMDRYAPVASGGATSMDTTLPVIVRYSGSGALITAFSSGFALSVAAPFSIMAIATLK
ncbi:MAG TPA: lysine exporter LysO family protein [Candidatus Acidoferrum sp.]|jgi:uncharacterized membrane protein YbjE (DUF340 family)|nr:lysine exporter LysO family protein [Candidatus Acidoferrum sp.]